MFKRILIANRGEIACRIIRTCRRLGVETVAVYSDADAGAAHVRLADRALRLGPPPAAESYLDIQRLLDAIAAADAEAVHPGYGFLSENAAFARAVADAGRVFIGPDAATMELMGSKARAKATLQDAGVPLVPGYHGDDQDDRVLLEAAHEVGFPLMLKAAAGGGGKGMRVVRAAADFDAALQAARREARGAFGDDRMILERYVQQPRHVEVQVFGDRHGQVVHLFERDCSSQRRHQKVIEEAPAPGLPPATRQALHAAGVAAAEAVGYVGAGTVEFLVEGESFYFLEMNTRLQVEHPVTEAITGLDLVEWQLRIAAGEPLPLTQAAITASGHAMEARLYAENPASGFLPSSGRILALALPHGGARVDAGVDLGDTVSVHYDPMIAKIIVHAPDRERCRAALQRALAASFVAGPDTNLGFLQRLAGHPAMRDGSFDTGLLDRDLDAFLTTEAAPAEVLAAAVAAALAQQQAQLESAPADPHSPWNAADGWRNGPQAPRRLVLDCEDGRLELRTTGHAGEFTFEHGGEQRRVIADHPEAGVCRVRLDGHQVRLHLHTHGDLIEVAVPGRRWRFTRHHRFETAGEHGTDGGRVLAPMPGKVIELRVKAGDTVSRGDVIAVMEAMKMELTINAPGGGTVEQVAVAVGDVVEADALLMEIRGE